MGKSKIPSSHHIGNIYLICFSSKLCHAKHYLGFSFESPKKRLELHKKGKGAKILKRCNELGINYHITRTWENVTRHHERNLKNHKNSKKLCPICNSKNYQKHGNF